MITRDLEGERRPQYTVLIFIDQETSEEIARLPEEGTLSVPDVGESVHLSTMELVDEGDGEMAREKETQEYTVESRSHDYSLLEYGGDEAEEIPSGDQLYVFISFEVSEVEFDTDSEAEALTG
ncbi:hypothetical protein J2751_000130 [Halorubrum alkaliphilum]|uniref:Uncharacterized protein n=1 Tax=Halorubrum alkaliphilum TaxID=261290 RepID=A0A8T4GBD9_9EURY|nr:hypothetical protein [Halorubrum alkaliphilum]MBP1921147.1 hypothetical protein [Halorubrum alkaliphilum]